jgi:hypothetical protein
MKALKSFNKPKSTGDIITIGDASIPVENLIDYFKVVNFAIEIHL